MEIKTKKSFNNLIKSLTEEIMDEEELDEITVTGNVAGYNTPFAFDPEGEKIKKKFGRTIYFPQVHKILNRSHNKQALEVA